MPIGGGLWVPVIPPRTAHWRRPTRRGPSRARSRGCRNSRAGSGQQAQRRHDRRRRSGQCQRRALRARRFFRRPHLLREGRHALLRIQPVRDPAHQHQGQGQTAHRQGEDRSRDVVCRAQARPARSRCDHESQRQGSRLGRGAGQRTARCSPPTTVSTSASTSARRCRSSTTTRRRSSSTARSRRCMSSTRSSCRWYKRQSLRSFKLLQRFDEGWMFWTLIIAGLGLVYF